MPLTLPHIPLTPPHIPFIFILHRADLEAQLAAMESKVLQGEAQGGLSELVRRQEEVLRRQQQQLQRQRSKDAAKLRQIADMEEAALMAQGKYSSLQARSRCLLALLLPFGFACNFPVAALWLAHTLPVAALWLACILLPFAGFHCDFAAIEQT